jgi:uncharacterized protein YlaI
MFNDLFNLVNLLDHDFREENGERIHSYMCRRCEIALRLRSFKEKIHRLLSDMNFEVGDPVEEKKTNVKASTDHN